MSELGGYTLKDMPVEMRPRERLLEHGAESLSSVELLAILLRVGTPNTTVTALAEQLLSRGGLRYLVTADATELAGIKGVGPAKIAQIKSALELGRRAAQLAPEERPSVSSPAEVAALVMSEMRFLSRETLRVLCLDSRNRLLAQSDISVGTVSAAVAHPRECYREAVRRNASSVVFVHNHPSGDPSPSPEDVALTRKLKEAGNLLGIDLADHVILGDGRHESLRERGLI